MNFMTIITVYIVDPIALYAMLSAQFGLKNVQNTFNVPCCYYCGDEDLPAYNELQTLVNNKDRESNLKTDSTTKQIVLLPVSKCGHLSAYRKLDLYINDILSFLQE